MDEDAEHQELLRQIDDLKAQLRELLDHLPDAFVETEIAEQRVVYLNRMAQLLFGYDAEDVRAGLPGKALRVLRGFAHFVGRQHRADDILVRTGGDEFALIVKAESEAEAHTVAERMLEATALDSPAGFSMGKAFRRPGEGLEAVLGRADRTMYAARGRRLRAANAPEGTKETTSGD